MRFFILASLFLSTAIWAADNNSGTDKECQVKFAPSQAGFVYISFDSNEKDCERIGDREPKAEVEFLPKRDKMPSLKK